MGRALLLLLLAAGCVHTVSSTATPADAKIKCVDCEAPVAVGLPIRTVVSWVGSCTSSGYISELHEDKDTGQISWERTPFSKTKECDEHRYKIDVACSSGCIVRSKASTESTNIRLVYIFPEHPGPLRYKITVHQLGGDPVAEVSGSVVVREPDGVSSDEKVLAFDRDTPMAVFDGWTYPLVPPKKFRAEFPSRGERYVPSGVEPDQPVDHVDKACFARAPGAADWKPCADGLHDGDDVRLDLLATAGGQPSYRQYTVESTADGVKWTCYRSSILEPTKSIEGMAPKLTCVRYGVPTAGFAIKWTSGTITEEETLGADAGPLSPISATGRMSAVTIDSRDAFDSRRGTIGDALGLFEGEYLAIRNLRILSGFVMIAATVSPRWGRLRVGIGDGEFVDEKVHPVNQKRLARVTLGWEKEFCSRERHLCAGAAIDGGYSFFDPIEGFYAVPEAIVSVRGRTAMIRFGIGQTYVLGTFKDPGQKTLEHGLALRLSVGFPHDF